MVGGASQTSLQGDPFDPIDNRRLPRFRGGKETSTKIEALKLREEALAFERRVISPSHPYFLPALENMAELYEKTGREDEAAKLRTELKALKAKQ